MTTKIAISLPDELATAAKRAVAAGHASSVSAYIAEAIRMRSQTEHLDDVLDQMLAESGGPLTSAERSTLDRLLDA